MIQGTFSRISKSRICDLESIYFCDNEFMCVNKKVEPNMRNYIILSLLKCIASTAIFHSPNSTLGYY